MTVSLGFLQPGHKTLNVASALWWSLRFLFWGHSSNRWRCLCDKEPRPPANSQHHLASPVTEPPFGGSSNPVKRSDDCSPSPHLDCNLSGDHKPEPSG